MQPLGFKSIRKLVFNESLMCHFIALEILFNERNSTSDKVCGRTAVLVHRSYLEPFEKVCRRIAALYDARSRYVHAGLAVGSEAAYESEQLVRVVLRNLLKLNTDPSSGAEDFYGRWLKQLDFIRAGIEAGQTFPEETMRANGVA